MPTHKPTGHNAVSPYLLVGDARAMLAFLQATFGAQELERKIREDGSVMHAEVRIDDSVVMLGERPDECDPVRGSTHVYVPDVDACYAAGLAAGAPACPHRLTSPTATAARDYATPKAICGGSAPTRPAEIPSLHDLPPCPPSMTPPPLLPARWRNHAC